MITWSLELSWRARWRTGHFFGAHYIPISWNRTWVWVVWTVGSNGAVSTLNVIECLGIVTWSARNWDSRAKWTIKASGALHSISSRLGAIVAIAPWGAPSHGWTCGSNFTTDKAWRTRIAIAHSKETCSAREGANRTFSSTWGSCKAILRNRTRSS